MISITVPSPGESISSVVLANWLVEDGDVVEKDQEVAEIDSDKATLSIAAPEDGRINIKTDAGETIDVCAEIATIDTSVSAEKSVGKPEKTPAEPAGDNNKEVQTEKRPVSETPETGNEHQLKLTPLARALMDDKDITENQLIELLKSKLIKKSDIESLSGMPSMDNDPSTKIQREREELREAMTTLRKKLAQRLVAVKNETAMLTTFNEIDMQRVLKVKDKYGKKFMEKHGVKLGIMSLFTRAAAIALAEVPGLNAMIDGDDIIYHNYADIGIAVSAPKGLMVPVIRNADLLSIPELEKEIRRMVEKARNNRISLDDMKGGTFSITNGGVFGNLMSTPLINPPQSGILGMHTIKERPVAIDGKVVIRPMMYVALSYDHRIVDGRESVGFLIKVKELIENPEMLLTKSDPFESLFNLKE